MGHKVLVGILLLGALFVFALSTFYVENWQFVLAKGYRLEARFPRAQTLDEGDVVRLAGVPVGTVRSLRVDTEVETDMPVTTVLLIRRGVMVRRDDEAVIRIGSLFGGNYVDIVRGDPAARPLEDGETIQKTSVAPSVTEVIEASTETLANINRAFEDIRSVTAEIAEGKGALGRLIHDEEFDQKLAQIVNDAADTMVGLKEASDRLGKGQGVLGKLIMDDALAADFQTVADNAKALSGDLKAISADLREGKGTLGKLLTDEQLYNDAKDVFALFRDGEGLFARLLSDQELSDNVSQAVANLREISEKINTGQSTIGKLLASSEAYDKLNASLDDINAFTAALAQGQGTLGRLVTDDKLYIQITQILSDVQGLLETYREQSPVISFAGAIFGAF